MTFDQYLDYKLFNTLKPEMPAAIFSTATKVWKLIFSVVEVIDFLYMCLHCTKKKGEL